MKTDIQKIEIVYKGFEISYDENTETYHSMLDERAIEKRSLKLCKKAIDEFIKIEKEFKPFEVYYYNSWRSLYVIVTITSIAEISYGYQKYWIKDSEGKRSKESIEVLFEKSEFNKNLFKQLKEKQEAQKKISDDIEKLQASLKNIK